MHVSAIQKSVLAYFGTFLDHNWRNLLPGHLQTCQLHCCCIADITGTHSWVISRVAQVDGTHLVKSVVHFGAQLPSRYFCIDLAF